MFGSLEEDSFLSQKVRIKKKFFNEEINLYHFFHHITKIYPVNIIVCNEFIFFLVKNEDFFNVKIFLTKLRALLKDKKILVIRSETTLIKLLFSFFPDTYIHDIALHIVESTAEILITIYFIIYEDRGIAVGRGGKYIKVINYIFENYIVLEESDKNPIKISCDIVNL